MLAFDLEPAVHHPFSGLFIACTVGYLVPLVVVAKVRSFLYFALLCASVVSAATYVGLYLSETGEHRHSWIPQHVALAAFLCEKLLFFWQHPLRRGDGYDRVLLPSA